MLSTIGRSKLDFLYEFAPFGQNDTVCPQVGLGIFALCAGQCTAFADYLQVMSAPWAISLGLLGDSLALGGPSASATMVSTIGCSLPQRLSASLFMAWAEIRYWSSLTQGAQQPMHQEQGTAAPPIDCCSSPANAAA